VILDIDLGGLGKDSQDPLIADGDFVRIAAVPTQIENAVLLAGAVRNPGPFEFRPGMRLKDLLTPEQLLVDSYMDRAELVRTDPVTYDVVVRPFSPRELFQGKEENPELRRLDKVVVATQVKSPRIANLTGEVKRPGQYTVESGERLSSVLKRAGGLTSRAFPQGIVLVRESVRKAQQAQIDKFVALQKQKMVMEAASLSAGSVTPQAGAGPNQEQMALQFQMQALDQMASRLQPGRVVVRMDSVEQLEQSAEDVTLEEGDSITIPVRAQTVSIIGAVKNPTSVVAYEGLRVEEYLRQAGGVTNDADDKELYILRANGETEAAYARLKDVRAGDTIVVPQLVEAKTRPLPFWQSIASIVGSVMLGVAAIAIIGR
jgi:polysaccharide biosynthesis/export protein